jgi:hypothetical protein
MHLTAPRLPLQHCAGDVAGSPCSRQQPPTPSSALQIDPIGQAGVPASLVPPSSDSEQGIAELSIAFASGFATLQAINRAFQGCFASVCGVSVAVAEIF